MSIFVSYSHEDGRWFEDDSLIPWLARSLKKDGVEIWWDRRGLSGGDPWRRTIEEQIDKAQIALLLVSQGFLNSEFIEQVELPRIKARAERKELVVIPILTEPCEWDEHDFISSRQMVPSKTTPLINYLGPNKEAEWAQARFEILSTIKKRLRGLAASPTAPAGEASLPVAAPEPGDAPARGGASWLGLEGKSRLLLLAAPLALLALVLGVWLLPRLGQESGTAAGTATAAPPALARAPSPTATPAPSPTTRPSPTPPPAEPISPENARRLSLRATLSGHRQGVTGLAFSRDGKTLASGSMDGSVRLWDVERGAEVRAVGGKAGQFTSVALSPDGKTLAAGMAADGLVRLWEAASGDERSTLTGYKQWLWSVAFSPDGKTLATADADGVKLRSVGSGEGADGVRPGIAPGVIPPSISLAFSPDGKALASGSVDQSVTLWDVASGKLSRTLQGHSDWVGGVAFSPDGVSIASVSWDHSVRLWDVNREASRHFAACGQGADRDASPPPIGIAFSPDGKLLASACGEETVRVWAVASGEQLATLSGHNLAVDSIAFSPDGRFLASASLDSTIRLWAVTGAGAAVANPTPAPGAISLANVDDLVARGAFVGHSGAVRSVAFFPNGQLLASGSADKTVKLWDVAGGKELRTVELGSGVNSLAFSPDGKLLVAGVEGGPVYLVNVADGAIVRTLAGHKGAVGSVAFSVDGKIVASGSPASADNSARLWDVSDGRELRSFSGQITLGLPTGVFSVALSSDGSLLAVGNGDFTATLWDVDSGKEVRTLVSQSPAGPLLGLAFSPGGKTMVSGSQGPAVKLWDVESGQELRRFSGHTTGPVRGLAFSPDGLILASAARDGMVNLWEAASGRLVRSLSGHEGGAEAVAFSADGKLLAAAGQNGLIRLWGLKAPN